MVTPLLSKLQVASELLTAYHDWVLTADERVWDLFDEYEANDAELEQILREFQTIERLIWSHSRTRKTFSQRKRSTIAR